MMIKTHRARLIVVLALFVLTVSTQTSGTVGDIALPHLIGAAAAQSPASQSYGYVCRFSVKTEYHTSEDVRVQVVAFYSQGGLYVPKPVHVSITVKYAGIGQKVKTVNLTINDPDVHTVNLGKFEMATYTAEAYFSESGEIKKDNFIVKHDPVPYTLYLNRGGKVIFEAKGGKNDTFTLKFILQRSLDNTEEKVFTNVSKKSYVPPDGIKVMSIYVIDKWGNVNGLNDGQPYVWVYTQDKYYNLIRIVAAVIIVIIVLIAIIRIWRRLM